MRIKIPYLFEWVSVRVCIIPFQWRLTARAEKFMHHKQMMWPIMRNDFGYSTQFAINFTRFLAIAFIERQIICILTRMKLKKKITHLVSIEFVLGHVWIHMQTCSCFISPFFTWLARFVYQSSLLQPEKAKLILFNAIRLNSQSTSCVAFFLVHEKRQKHVHVICYGKRAENKSMGENWKFIVH